MVKLVDHAHEAAQVSDGLWGLHHHYGRNLAGVCLYAVLAHNVSQELNGGTPEFAFALVQRDRHLLQTFQCSEQSLIMFLQK